MVMNARFVKGTPVPVDYTPGTAKTGGSVIVIGEKPYIAHRDIAAGEMGALMARGGRYECPCDGAMTGGARVYWDATNSKLTLSAGNNKHFGYLIPDAAPAADGDLAHADHNPGGVAGGSSSGQAAVVAIGADQAGGALLSLGWNYVTGANAAKGVRLPVGKAGDEVWVKNVDNAALLVYPETGGVINTIAANGSLSMAARVPALYKCSAALQWYTLPLLPS